MNDILLLQKLVINSYKELIFPKQLLEPYAKE